MKLLVKTTLLFTLSFGLILVVASFLFLHLVNTEFKDELDEQLNQQFEAAIAITASGKEVNLPMTDVEQLTDPASVYTIYRDTFLVDPEDGEPERYRFMEAVRHLDNESYRFRVYAYGDTWKDLQNLLMTLFLVLAIALLILSLVINTIISRQLWKPFRSYLRALAGFSASEKSPLKMEHSTTTEFEELRSTLGSLTTQVREDYHRLKDFTENASHEMQTPIGVLQAKIDRMRQDEQLSKESSEALDVLHSAAGRLSKLVEAMGLLARVEGAHYRSLQPVNISSILSEQLTNLRELWEAMDINFKGDIAGDVIQIMDPLLAGHLINNLLSNAIKHNLRGGQIMVSLSPEALIVKNTGTPLAVPPESLFDRFAKGDPASGSTGLGLSIIHAIARQQGWLLNYENNGQWHEVTMTFQNSDLP